MQNSEYRSVIDVSKQIIDVIPKNEIELITKIENFKEINKQLLL